MAKGQQIPFPLLEKDLELSTRINVGCFRQINYSCIVCRGDLSRESVFSGSTHSLLNMLTSSRQ